MSVGVINSKKENKNLKNFCFGEWYLAISKSFIISLVYLDYFIMYLEVLNTYIGSFVFDRVYSAQLEVYG